MNTRLQQFLIAENISQSQFADRIGVARASVSHIMAGRNKPGFDFIESMSREFPTLNLEWLIMGKGRMYKDSSKVSLKNNESSFSEEENLFSTTMETPASNNGQLLNAPQIVPPASKQSQSTESNTLGSKSKVASLQRSVSKIIVFYDDGTYQELK